MLRIDPSLTEDQQKAVAARGASVSVSAAAGSGKTKVLVERLIGIITDEEHPSPADRLVVVTFTNDAASEVRSRLSIALSKQLLEDPDNAWLREQQTHLKSAHISTIHSFCFDLLRQQFAALDISAGFRVMDDTEEAELRRKTAEEVAEAMVQAAETDPEAAARLRCLSDAFCGTDDSALLELLEALYEIIATVPFGEQMLPRFAQEAASGKMLADAMQEFCGQIAECETVYAQAQALFDSVVAEKRAEKEAKAAKSGRAVKPYEPPKSYDVLCAESRGIGRVLEAAKTGDPERTCKALNALSFGRFSPGSDARARQSGALRAFGKQMAANLQKKWRIPLEYAQQDCARHAELLTALIQPLHEFSERLDAHKRERSALGFGDAMRCTLHLLAEQAADGSIRKTALAETLSQQYSYIMIDEFQDADGQQDLIFRMLSHGGDAQHYGDNLFFVGDSKQCIYRFRNANPRIFYEALQSGAPYRTAMLTENTRIDLNRNFRSAQEVVDFVNCIFSGLMSERVGEVDYDERQALVRGAAYPDGDRPAELLLFEEAEDNPQTEPDLVAARIRMHLDLGTPVKDRETGVQRPCKPGDFMILLRKKSKLEAFASALTRAEIPVCSVVQQSYLNAPEILLLLAILRAADNPLLDVPVAAAMLSPMMGFTLDEVTQIRLSGERRGLYRSMLHITQTPESASPELTVKCTHFLQFLESMRLCAAMETPEQLIRRIYLCTDFLGLMQMTEGGEQKKANLRALVTYARKFEENRGGGLSAFLRYIDAMISRSQDLDGGGIPAVSEDVVQIKTIHGSKGLEAPFVILADASTGFSTADRRKMYQFHADKGLGFRLQDPESLTRGSSLAYMAISAQNIRESVSEELRLLYVALTRARERLILPISLKGIAAKAKQWAEIQAAGGAAGKLLAGSAGSHADWLLMPLIRNQAGELLRRTLDIEVEKDPGLPQIRMVTEVIAPPDAPAQETAAHTSVQAAPPPTVERHLLEKQCAWQYESAGAHLTAKYGVSELAKSDDISAPLRRPLFVRENHGRLSGAERGTALHTFLQYANFAAAAQDLSAEIAHVRRRGRLTEKQAEAVRASNIAAFFTSPLYARTAAAKQIWREKKFIVRLSDLHLSGSLAQLGADYAGTEGMLTGIMDLVFEEADGLVLVDYKTDRVQNGAQLLEQYTEQIRLYAGALRLITGKRIKECFLYSLHLNQTVPVAI